MKNFFFSTLALLFVSLFATPSLQAQSPAEAEILKMWNDVWNAYERDDLAKVWSYYAEKACEIYPDGSTIHGVANIKAGYEQFMGMVEGRPSWSATKPAIRFITPDVALLTSDVVADIKLKGGQQVGGKSTFALLARKANNGKWLIEFDSQTPVLQMPPAGN
jgi:uncharacterized protein (TIGR02246 family)